MRMRNCPWKTRLATFGAAAGVVACSPAAPRVADVPSDRFAADVAFLRQHSRIVILADAARGAQVAVAPAYQGRVLTSTTGGNNAPSFGWIGREAIRSGRRRSHMNVFGGEDRFWLGPEGGQYGLYFAEGDPFDLDHWQVPEPLDWGPWEIASTSGTAVRFRQRMALVNYSGTHFQVDVDRTVRLLTADDIAAQLGQSP